MRSPYSLTLVSSGKPDVPGGITNSVQMIGWGLWREFSKLPHVSLSYCDAYFPVLGAAPSDFAIAHCYFDAPIFKDAGALRSLASRGVANFMETDLPGSLVDYNFCFRPRSEWADRSAPGDVVAFPFVSDLLGSGAALRPGSVLIDHPWFGADNDPFLRDLYDWLEPLSTHAEVAQLKRSGSTERSFPSWVRAIPEMNYADYLAETAGFENFVVTHRESYGHSVVDMAARGARVLVPMRSGATFCPASTVDALQLCAFSTRDEFLALLRAPHVAEDCRWRRGMMTDMPEAVARVDAYFQKVLAGGVAA